MMKSKPKVFEIPGGHVYEGVTYDGFFPAFIIEKIGKFKFRPDDVLVSGYSKSGTTWLNEMVWMAVNNLDTAGARESSEKRIPILEQVLPTSIIPNMELLESRASPRVIATHLCADFYRQQIQNNKIRVIHMIRNPKDMLAANYHFYRLVYSRFVDLQWDDYFETFKEKKLSFGDWFEHTKSWLEIEARNNVLLLKYEDAKQDHKGTVKQIAQFLKKDLSDAQIDAIVEYTSVTSMKKNPATNKQAVMSTVKDENFGATFFRSEKIGEWKNLFSQDQSEFVDGKFRDTFGQSGLYMQFE